MWVMNETNLTVIGHETKYEIRNTLHLSWVIVIKTGIEDILWRATEVLAFAGNAREYAHTSIPGH